MIRSLNEIKGYRIVAKDGDIGKVSDFYFDDRDWVVRYLVDKTGFWLFGRQVLISPQSMKKPNWSRKEFPVSLTREQVENSPTVEADKTVSRKHEKELTGYFGWPAYWAGNPGGFSQGYYAGVPSPVYTRDIAEDEGSEGKAQLRSFREVNGYTIDTESGDLGEVDDFLVDDENWIIRYMIVDTKKVLEGKKVLISPEWIKWISWYQKKVSVNMQKETIKSCPDFDLSTPVSRKYEDLIYEHYGCNKYWNNK